MIYKLLDLFSGIGGFHKGLSEAGLQFDRVCFSEIDKHAIAVYQHNNPEAEYHGSVTTIRGNELRKSESEKWIITFGSPCQDLSLAGKRKGMGGSRSSLFFEATRIIRELKPDYFIWENVKGAFSSNERKDFIAVLREIADIGGYGCQWELCNTRWFLPQNRERIYLVGCLGGCSGREIFPIGEQIKMVAEQKQHAKMQVASTLQGVGGHVANGEYKGMNLLQIGTWRTHKDGQGFREVSENICPTIPARAREDGSGQPVIIQKSNLRLQGKLTKHKSCPTLKANTKKGDTEPLVVIPVLTPDRLEKRQNGRRFKENSEPSFTLTAQDKHGVMMEDRIRRLTPIECERLQGFPDNWTKNGLYDGEVKLVSDTQRYKMCGNAVSVPVVKAIGEKLF